MRRIPPNGETIMTNRELESAVDYSNALLKMQCDVISQMIDALMCISAGNCLNPQMIAEEAITNYRKTFNEFKLKNGKPN